MKAIYIIVFILSGLCLLSCEEEKVENMYSDINIRFAPTDSTIIFEEFEKSTLDLIDMNFPGQGQLKYSCHGDTTLTVVKSYYDISFDGYIIYRQGENGHQQRKKFRSTANYQVVLTNDTTITLPLAPMY